jgi:PTH1 family peptidyl-tRNA hydrolase
MKIIIGLGNPGKRYENTRHNIGFLVIDKFTKENNFPDFKSLKKFNAQVSERILNGEKIIIVKPETYMNESGKSIKKLMDFYKLKAEEFIIIHDDIDLLEGKIKISSDRGSAGHKGVDSIFNETKSKKFIRLRVGINPNLNKTKKAMDVVLKKFNSTERINAKKTIDKTINALDCLLTNGLENTMTKYNS